MKTKFNGILMLLLAFVVQFTFAQEKTISGTVTDDSGPLPGVSVIIKGTTKGTETDFDGKYSIKANTGDILVFSFIGMAKQEKTVGETNKVNVVLVANNILDEVVVTSLGIKRKAAELSYAISTVKSEDITVARETNVVDALQGKTSGVQITKQSGNLGGSSKILIRGISSLGGTNNPLWVVDGTPIFDSNISTGSRISGGFDVGNGASDINPDDIASISILKGANAAALYGSRASAGVIIITTKRGKQGNKASIKISSSVRFDNPLRLPKFQNEFGPGNNDANQIPVYNLNGGTGWGPRITGQSLPDFTGATVALQAYPNNVKDFYETGVTLFNSISLSGAGENNDYRLGFSTQDRTGIAPASELKRRTITINTGRKFNDKLSSRFSASYIRTTSAGSVAQGANDPNVLSNLIYNSLPRTTDFSLFKPWVNPDGTQRNAFSNTTNNPYWIANENRFDTQVDRLFGSAELTYKPKDWLNLLARVGYDFRNDVRFRNNRIGTLGRLTGDFTDDNIRQRQLTLDLIGTIKKDISKNLTFTFRGGYQLTQRFFDRIGDNASQLVIDGLYDPGNAITNAPFKDFSKRFIYGFYGETVFNYKEALALTLTARNDWSSTLPQFNNRNSYFYPSAGLSWLFSKSLNLEDSILNYGKLRFSVARVGVDTGFSQLLFTFNADTSYFGQFGTGGNFPFDGNPAFNGPNTIPAGNNLRAEQQTSYEAGIELEFFKGRIRFDGTAYRNVTTNQILPVPIPETSGFGFRVQNIGQVSNKGIEIELKTRVIKTENFNWDLNYNFTTNDFKVDALAPGVERLVINSGFNGSQVIAEPGESFGLYGNRFSRAVDSDGNIIEDQIIVNSNGLRTTGDNARLGDVMPDYTMGLTSQISFKNISLTTTFDLRQGGVIFSATTQSLRFNGVAAETADRTPFVDPNTFVQPGGPGTAVSPNTTPVQSVEDYFVANNGSIAEGSTFDASFIKLREIGLSYTFTSKMLEKTPIRGLKIGIEGRNVALLKSNVPHIDPEVGLFGSANDGAGIERGGLPTTRSIGFNIKLNF